MSRDPRTQLKPRARPVAELSLDGLISHDDELARRWVASLVLARPLARLHELPILDLPRDAPALCSHALRALSSDSDLERLAAGEGTLGAARDAPPARTAIAALLGAGDPPGAVTAVEALRGVLWEALLDELSQPSPRLLSDLSDRLAAVCSAILLSALSSRSQLLADRPLADARGPIPDWDREPDGLSPQHRPAVLVDELHSPERPSPATPAPAGPPDPAPATPASTAPSASTVPSARTAPSVKPRPLPWDIPGDGLRVSRSERSLEAAEESA
jgi:hypothetical protein